MLYSLSTIEKAQLLLLLLAEKPAIYDTCHEKLNFSSDHWAENLHITAQPSAYVRADN